tara:strand:- start:517 stop:1056 length:540 start_codon:yes stop_codon:yes gene_type:complete
MKNKILLTALTISLTSGSGIAYKAYAEEGAMDHSKHQEMNMGEAKSHDHGDHSGHEMAGDSKVIMGKGVINSVSKMNNKVNLTHEPIPALGWPAMTMDLAVADDVDLKSLASDQEVMFHMILGEDKIYRITKIVKADEKMDHSNMDHDAQQCEAGKDCPMHDDMKHDNSDGHHGEKNHH